MRFYCDGPPPGGWDVRARQREQIQTVGVRTQTQREQIPPVGPRRGRDFTTIRFLYINQALRAEASACKGCVAIPFIRLFSATKMPKLEDSLRSDISRF